MAERSSYPNARDRTTIAFLVIGWIVAEPGRAERFLTLTGLDGEQLRARLTDDAVQNAALTHVLGHEPDLLACADAIGLPPRTIAAAAGDGRDTAL